MKNREKELREYKMRIQSQLQDAISSSNEVLSALAIYKQVMHNVPLELKQQIQEDPDLTELYEEMTAGIQELKDML